MCGKIQEIAALKKGLLKKVFLDVQQFLQGAVDFSSIFLLFSFFSFSFYQDNHLYLLFPLPNLVSLVLFLPLSTSATISGCPGS